MNLQCYYYYYYYQLCNSFETRDRLLTLNPIYSHSPLALLHAPALSSSEWRWILILPQGMISPNLCQSAESGQ